MDVPKLRILLVGNGGREHALSWKLSQSSNVEHIYVVPGNGGTATVAKCTNVDSVSAEDFAALARFAKEHGINLLVPGPEAPLVAGIADYFQQHVAGVGCFGPSKLAARMEGSKTFSKDFMKAHNIPTAAYENFNDYEKAKKYLDTVDHDVVIKADGLAAGKGVIIPKTKEEAQAALKDIMLDKEFGDAGNEVVVEEFLEGEELSILTFSDGYSIRSLPPAQDHKRIGDGDTGPNTGGMGTYAPTRVVTDAQLKDIDRTIIQPTIDGMRKSLVEGYPFVGVLFTGFMMTESGPRVLEYNVRFGDPETQSCLSLMKSDLAEIMLACTHGCLDAVELEIEQKYAATVVVAAGGYPGAYKKGTEMILDDVAEGKNYTSKIVLLRDTDVSRGTVLFHAGTTLADSKLKTSGGRVIAATATAESLADAVRKAYKGVGAIHFEGMQYRKDIAARALK
ncbi:Bifunctional purine biosynthetic protein ADE1 [Cryomyces antarcticus]|uniref:phosphoribosylamine--glycine ligase n=1 Tax=Cryomyces antarcticus TaxID=329879 RepID=A0ABR0LYV0_9PEZI|nr:Bifunctional purine biosynthetic protein ADE1 [Cryomyces antarcticus]KAK5256919.1 Bifunctional purine biosynthetic protein ADE1 [Cryomyces antarcticus]